MLIKAKSPVEGGENHKLKPFLGRDFKDPEALTQVHMQLKDRKYPREQLAAILRQYNQSIGNDDLLVMRNIDRLASGDACVVTGQQLGFMGGPAYTVLKGITCLKVAHKTKSVPIFWLATEDHDIAEIDHTYLIDSLGNLQRFYLPFPKDGHSVEDLTLSPKHEKEIDRFFDAVGVFSPERPQIFPTYARTMAAFLAKQFVGTGLIFLEPKLLRPLAGEFFKKEIQEHLAIQEVLKTTSEKLAEAGGSTPLPVGKGANLFLKSRTGLRQKLRWEGDAFVAGGDKYSVADCLALCDSHPERFSPSAAARPLLQSSLLPVLAYIAGPSEMAYYRQLLDYHHFHNVPMPCIIPRMKATLIPAEGANFLEKCHLEPWEILPHHWSEFIPSLDEDLEKLQEKWLEIAVESFGSDISEQTLARLVKHGAHKLKRKLTQSRLRRQGIPSFALHFLRNLLTPHGKPQERVLNWWGFQRQSSENLIQEFLKLPEENPEAHLYSYFK